MNNKIASRTEERKNKCNTNGRNNKCCPQENETPEAIRESDRQQFLYTSGQWVHQQGIFMHCQGSKKVHILSNLLDELIKMYHYFTFTS